MIKIVDEWEMKSRREALYDGKPVTMPAISFGWVEPGVIDGELEWPDEAYVVKQDRVR